MVAQITKVFQASPRYGIGTICTFNKEKDGLTGELRYTYCGFEELYKSNKKHFDFNASQFASFDGRFTQTAIDMDHTHLQGIYAPGGSHYSEDAVMRKNIALLRMYLYTQYFPDGEFDYKKYEHRLAQKSLNEMGAAIARIYEDEMIVRTPGNTLGFIPNLFEKLFTGLSRLLQLKNPFIAEPTSQTNTSHAERRYGDLGKEHIGAAVLYQRLYEMQNQKTLNPVRWLNGKTNAYDWGLPPIEETPFRSRDIQEAISHDTVMKEAGVAHPSATLVADALWTFEVNYNLAHATSKPERLPDEEAEKAVILARHILDELSKMKFNPSNRVLDAIELRDKHLQEAQCEAELCMTYQKIILDLAAHDPAALQQDGRFAAAQQAIGKLGFLTIQKAKEEAYRVADADLAQKLMREERNLPEAYKNVDAREEKSLIKTIEVAIQAAVHYRDQKTKAPVLKHAGVQLSPNAAQAVQFQLGEMRHRIENTSAYIAGASTTKANWAIHAAEVLNREKEIQMQQKQLLHSQTAITPPNQSRQIAKEALQGEAETANAQRQLLEKRQQQQAALHSDAPLQRV